MSLYFGGISAFTFWRAQGAMPNCYMPCRRAELQTDAHDFDLLCSVRQALPVLFRGQMHLCVSEPNDRRRRRGLSFSVLRPPLPPNAFVLVAPNIYIASPELCYLQMANQLSPLQLTKWGMELCGTYRIDPTTDKRHQRDQSLTDVERLTAFLSNASGMMGARRAKEAARWVMDGADSAQESQLALCFRVPRQRGGRGIGTPLLNPQIHLSPEIQKIAGKPYYRVDELWGKGDLALEYESDEFHNNAYQAPRDRRRRNILQHIGIRVITVNTSQLKNLMEVDNLADQILKHLGRRQHPLPTEYQRKHAQFHRELIRIDPVFRL